MRAGGFSGVLTTIPSLALSTRRRSSRGLMFRPYPPGARWVPLIGGEKLYISAMICLYLSIGSAFMQREASCIKPNGYCLLSVCPPLISFRLAL